jgi:hypothetical protein
VIAGQRKVACGLGVVAQWTGRTEARDSHCEGINQSIIHTKVKKKRDTAKRQQQYRITTESQSHL